MNTYTRNLNTEQTIIKIVIFAVHAAILSMLGIGVFSIIMTSGIIAIVAAAAYELAVRKLTDDAVRNLVKLAPWIPIYFIVLLH